MGKLIWAIIIIVLLIVIYYAYTMMHKPSTVSIPVIPSSSAALSSSNSAPVTASVTPTSTSTSTSTSASASASASAAQPQIIIYSLPNYQGQSYTLPGPGNYPLSKGCGSSSLSVLPFKPQSIKMPSGYKVQIQGYYGNPGDSTCGPSATYATNPAQLFNAWMLTNTNGSLNIIA